MKGDMYNGELRHADREIYAEGSEMSDIRHQPE